MPIICDEYGVFLSHVPATGGDEVGRVLVDHAGGREVRPRYATFRVVAPDPAPPVRAVTLRDPVSWYREYWAACRATMRHPRAWPVRERGDRRHPTTPLDSRCGAPVFEDFVRSSLREFPNGFLRTMYCEFLNGATHVLRADHLAGDTTALLESVGHPDPSLARRLTGRGRKDNPWRERATLSRALETRLRDVENLEGLALAAQLT